MHSLTQLLQSSSGSPDEPAHVMTLFEVVSTLNMIKEDDRIVRATFWSLLPLSSAEQDANAA